MMDVDFLMLDDLGKEHQSQSGFIDRFIDRVIRHRARNLLVTIITTNLNRDGFNERYGKSITEIVIESMIALRIDDSENHRRPIQKGMIGQTFGDKK